MFANRRRVRVLMGHQVFLILFSNAGGLFRDDECISVKRSGECLAPAGLDKSPQHKSSNCYLFIVEAVYPNIPSVIFSVS